MGVAGVRHPSLRRTTRRSIAKHQFSRPVGYLKSARCGFGGRVCRRGRQADDEPAGPPITRPDHYLPHCSNTIESNEAEDRRLNTFSHSIRYLPSTFPKICAPEKCCIAIHRARILQRPNSRIYWHWCSGRLTPAISTDNKIEHRQHIRFRRMQTNDEFQH
jgi:hypothetical protein